MKEIKLTKGFVALVDDEDYERVSALNWYASVTKSNVYAHRNANRKVKKDDDYVCMHRMVMGVSDPAIEVDHINNNGLDNRKENLRQASRKENSYNLGNRKGRDVKGVCWHKTRNKWRAYIAPNHKQIHLGVFDKKEDAIKAYNEAALKHFGSFAKIN